MAQQLANNLAQFIVRIRRYLRETDASKSQWTDNLLKQLFNAQYRLRCSELVMAYEGYFTLIGTRDIVADQGRYAWPEGFQRLLKLELVRSDSRRIPIQRYERHIDAYDTPSTGQDDYLPTYRPVGSGFVLEPAPTTAVTGGIYMEWNGVPEELTDDGDAIHSDFPAMYDELLVLDTAVHAFDIEGQQESGLIRSLLRQRAEWMERWERFVDQRTISTQHITPFIGWYQDS